MSEIQYADPAARRRAVWLVVFGALIGGFALVALERYLPLLKRWLLSDPDQLEQRVTTVVVFLVVVITIPLFAFAAHLWVRGTYVHRYQRFPVRGEHVIRDIPIVRGEAAAVRGRVLQCFAIGLAGTAILLAVALVRLATVVVAYTA